MPDWILRANRARAVPPLGMVQNTYRTRTVQYQRINVCILFWKIMLNQSLIVILWPTCGLMTQIINHNRSNFELSKLVLTGVCCKHFMYTCMHRSCTLSCVTWSVCLPTLWSDFYSSSKIPTGFFWNMNVKFCYFSKIWLINNTIIFNLIKTVPIINHNYIITLLLKWVGRYKNNYFVTHGDVYCRFILSV